MTQGEGVLPPPIRGIDVGEWRELVAHGRQRGSLTADEVVDVLHDVELTPEAIEVVRRGLEDHDITVDQSFELDDSGEIRRVMAQIDPTRSEGTRRRVVRARSTRPFGDGGDPDTLRWYMNEIGRIPLLDAEGERRLARAMEEGLAAARDLSAVAERSPSVERRLRRAVEGGERARQQLITANLRLVVSIAKRYVRPTMPLADAIQSGNIGLMKAVERFDHSRGFKFSTYATWWIRQSISRAVAEESRNIRLPAHTVEHVNRIQRTQRELLQRLRREPTIHEVAEFLGESPDRVAEILQVAVDTTSLDQPKSDDSDSTFADSIATTESVDPSDSLEREVMRDAVRLVIGELPAREQEVMRMRFGLDGSDGATLEEVGRAFRITRERVRQIEVRTLERLRHMAGARALRDYVDG